MAPTQTGVPHPSGWSMQFLRSLPSELSNTIGPIVAPRVYKPVNIAPAEIPSYADEEGNSATVSKEAERDMADMEDEAMGMAPEPASISTEAWVPPSPQRTSIDVTVPSMSQKADIATANADAFRAAGDMENAALADIAAGRAAQQAVANAAAGYGDDRLIASPSISADERLGDARSLRDVRVAPELSDYDPNVLPSRPNLGTIGVGDEPAEIFDVNNPSLPSYGADMTDDAFAIAQQRAEEDYAKNLESALGQRTSIAYTDPRIIQEQINAQRSINQLRGIQESAAARVAAANLSANAVTFGDTLDSVSKQIQEINEAIKIQNNDIANGVFATPEEKEAKQKNVEALKSRLYQGLALAERYRQQGPARVNIETPTVPRFKIPTSDVLLMDPQQLETFLGTLPKETRAALSASAKQKMAMGLSEVDAVKQAYLEIVR